jgi:hypothetical protein
MTFEQRRDAIAAAIRSSGWLRMTASAEHLEDLLKSLASAADADRFDEVWDEVYDLADEDRVWIATV